MIEDTTGERRLSKGVGRNYAKDAVQYMKKDPELSIAEKLYYWNVIDRLESREDSSAIRGMLMNRQNEKAYERLKELDGGRLLQEGYAPIQEGIPGARVAAASWENPAQSGKDLRLGGATNTSPGVIGRAVQGYEIPAGVTDVRAMQRADGRGEKMAGASY